MRKRKVACRRQLTKKMDEECSRIKKIATGKQNNRGDCDGDAPYLATSDVDKSHMQNKVRRTNL